MTDLKRLMNANRTRILTGLTALAVAAAGALAAASAQGGPSEADAPRSWFRNFDYGVERDGKALQDGGLYQVVGKPFLLVHAPSLDTCYVLSVDPQGGRVVRPVRREQVAVKNELEVALAEAAFATAPPIPYIQDGQTAVVFYAEKSRYRIARIPPLVGDLTLDQIFQHSPLYRRGMEEYRPNTAAVAALKATQDKATIEVWFGSWCPHCQQVVPRFLKAMQQAANPNFEVTYHAVPREFAGYEPAAKKDVKGLPTFIILRNGREVGRIRGGPSNGTMEEEIARILGLKVAAASR